MLLARMRMDKWEYKANLIDMLKFREYLCLPSRKSLKYHADGTIPSFWTNQATFSQVGRVTKARSVRAHDRTVTVSNK
jgi:hypothetical protein